MFDNYLRSMFSIGLTVAAAVGGIGCSGGSTQQYDLEGDVVAETKEALVVHGWSPPYNQKFKIARNPTLSPYIWRDNQGPALSTGKVCRGAASTWNFDLACDTYTLPYNPTTGRQYVNRDIAAIAIAQNTSHVFTWWSDGYVSEGTSVNLGYYDGASGPRAFVAPYPLNTLIDADVSPNGQVYYYWYPPCSCQLHGITRVTYGSSTNAGTIAGSDIVNTDPYTTLVSISFLRTPNRVEGWFLENELVVLSSRAWELEPWADGE